LIRLHGHGSWRRQRYRAARVRVVVVRVVERIVVRDRIARPDAEADAEARPEHVIRPIEPPGGVSETRSDVSRSVITARGVPPRPIATTTWSNVPGSSVRAWRRVVPAVIAAIIPAILRAILTAIVLSRDGALFAVTRLHLTLFCAWLRLRLWLGL